MLFDKNKNKHKQCIIDVNNNKAIVAAFLESWNKDMPSLP